jgi:LysM repeat protein
MISMDEDNIPEGAPPDQDERSWQKMTGDQGAFPAADKAADSERESRVLLFWERLSQMGLSDTLLRLGTHMLSIALVLLVVWVMREFYLRAQVTDSPRQAALAAVLPTPTPTEIAPELPPFADQAGVFFSGIPRFALVHTTLPTLPRTEVITYTVQTGDTIFGIAEKYGLKPETILWGNYYVLADNPDNLVPGEVLNILPMNGTYHRWSAG